MSPHTSPHSARLLLRDVPPVCSKTPFSLEHLCPVLSSAAAYILQRRVASCLSLLARIRRLALPALHHGSRLFARSPPALLFSASTLSVLRSLSLCVCVCSDLSLSLSLSLSVLRSLSLSVLALSARSLLACSWPASLLGALASLSLPSDPLTGTLQARRSC